MEHIKKILLRMTALVLVLTMTVGLVPAAAAAPADAQASLDGGDYRFEGKNPLGNLIAGTLSEEAETELEEELTGYNVTGLQIEGSTATVEYEALEAARLVVALYTEDGMQLLTSANADVTPEESQAVVTFVEEMPEFFMAEAYLLDSYDYSPLCTPYETARYTRDIQELIASDIHDYDAELVLNLDESEETNFAVYHETTVRIEEREGVNLVTTLDYENNVFVIENADEQFTSLTEGDVISYFYDGGSMLLARVAKIEIDGTTVTIHGGDLEMEEVFSHLKIESESDPDTVEADPSDLDDGVEFVGPCDMTPYGSSGAYETHDLSGEETLSRGFEHTLKEKKYCGGDVTLAGKVKLGVTASVDYYIAGDRAEVEFVVQPGVEFQIEVKAEGDASKFAVKLAQIIIPLIPGVVDAAFVPYLQLKFTASVTFTASASFDIGLSITKKGVFKKPKIKNLSKMPSVEIDLTVEGTIFLGIEVSPEALIGAGAASTGVAYEGGVELTGTLVELKNDGLYHECAGLCITGKSYKRHALKCKARLLKWEGEKTLAEKRIRIKNLDFYLCALHSEAGFGECPHVLRKITVTVKDENGAGVENASVYSQEAGLLVGDDTTNSKGVAVLYLPEGEHEVTVHKDALTKHKTVKVSDDPKKVTIKLVPDKPEEDGEEDEDEDDALDGTDGDELVDYGVVESSGAFSESLKWTFYDSGLLLIEGEGVMDSFTSADPIPWKSFEDQVESLIVKEGVTTISDYAFSGMDNLKYVTILEGVTGIGRFAFGDCGNLTEVELPDSLLGIEYGAFSDCGKIERLTIGSGLEYIEEYAFAHYNYDSSFHMNINIDSVEHWMNIDFEAYSAKPSCNRRYYLNFEDSALGVVTIPDSITEVEEGIFARCDNITHLVVSDHVTYIGEEAFFDCNGLETIVFGDGLTHIARAAFESCSRIREIHFGNSLMSVDWDAFEGGKTGITKAYIPTLQDWLDIQFANPEANPLMPTVHGKYYSELYIDGVKCTEVVIPEGMEVRGTYSFAGYDYLTAVTLPESMTEIPEGMFYSCFYLENIEIPEHVTVIGQAAFSNCNFLRECSLPDGLTTIEDNAFNYCKYLRRITIPDSVTTLGDSVFACCENLKEVIIPDSVSHIGEYAFSGCIGLETIKLPEGLTAIENRTFGDCSHLTSVTIPDTVTHIGHEAFLDCDSLESLTIPASVTTIGEWAIAHLFGFKTSLTEVYFCGDAPSTVSENHGGRVFYGITATVYYPAGNPTWTQEAMDAMMYPPEYGDEGVLTWVPYTPGGSNGIRGELTTLAAPEKPAVGTDAIYGGEYGSGELDGVTVKTADFDGLLPGAEYVLLVLASLEAEDRLAADNLLYIDHAAATEDGTASFTYIPKTLPDRSIVVLCGPSAKDLKDAQVILTPMGCDGETWAVEPTVIYDGVTLIEGEDYELIGSVSYQEPGTYTFWIQGIRDYTGLVECTYTAADHVHEFGEYTADGNAACLADGTRTATCLHCAQTHTLPDEGSALGHDWDEGVVTIEPTEETEGEIFHTCLRCGETRTEILPRKEHVHEYEVWGVWTPTCKSGGYTIYICRTCSEMKEDDFTDPTPHPWDAGVITVEPTEETEGEILYTCTYCGETRTEPVPKLHNHTNIVLQVVEPTCTTGGYTIYECTYCGEITETDYVDAPGHDWDEGVVILEPTVDHEGEMLYTCARCGESRTEYLPRLHEHDFYYYDQVQPTCYSQGYTVYLCSECGETRYDDYVPMIDHTWDEGVVTVEPTPETEGEMLYSCIYCDATRTEVLPKAHVHSYMVLRVVAATCTEEGYTIYLCSDCGEVLFDDYTDALGHSFGGWTDAGNGMEERTCERCGHTEQRTAGGPVNPFTDVPEGSFYYDPVMWAVANGITNGTTPTTFGPNDQCMRAHVVTFLWRAAGSPEPSSTENPFVDVKPTDFYYKAVLWAVEKGVTNGLDAAHFGPFAYCNRAQVVTFLYRSLGSPAVESYGNPFTDVPEGQWFTAPVLWAVENGVTNGLSATAFGPTAICNRAQIVTFLYRAFAV